MSDPVELIERRVQAVLDGQRSTQGLHLFCQIGGRGLSGQDGGITTLQISGSGWALVGWRDGDDAEMFSHQLSDADMRKIYGLLMRFPFWTASPRKREREENELNIHVRISDQEKGISHGIQFYSDDAEEFPILKDLMQRIDSLISALSEGVIEGAQL
ncbi:hypothetical protein FRD01_04365 [Microvenator marinus]|uniref:Uncharacterized protein n=1 Tax=Microvenator marinus TaxID=2600177 RepID=A0A5B8XL03_9DELT|nr:hypothetical protein [Microvenator marinus]QED26492.1 hypothetical protein FRD01_04365 [Microvenator marinus]